MIRLNLQLFALNTKESIVDYLKSVGEDSSYSARSDLAASLGISNYSGTAEQNTQLLNALKNSSSSNTTSNNTAKSNSNVAGSSNTTINGVDQATLDKMNSSFSASESTQNAQKEAGTYLDKVKELANVTDIISQETWDAINTPFNASSAYNEAMNYTNSLLEQLSTGRTSYSDQVDAMIEKIQNREEFSYDVDQDTLFQQALASAMSSGKTAMQDTIGQASALTGGYGSTYATSAGNQAYNAYLEDAYNNLPEYYQMAMEAYQMEGQEMYNQLAMLNDADAKEYERLYNSWSANFNNAQNMYQNEYNSWRDGVSNAISSAGLQLNEYGQIFDQAYSAYNAVANDAQTKYQNEYNAWADQVNNAFKYAGMLNSDYWNDANLEFNKQQHSDDMGYKYAALEQDKLQHEAEMLYKYDALKQDDTQFYASLNAKTSKEADDAELKDASETQNAKALDAYNNGGMQALNQYLNSLPSDVNKDAIAQYVADFGYYPDDLDLVDRNWSVVDKGGINWIGGIDNNGTVSDGKNTYSLKDLKKELMKSGMTEDEAHRYIITLQQDLGIAR